jgi:hypothetical protein
LTALDQESIIEIGRQGIAKTAKAAKNIRSVGK